MTDSIPPHGDPDCERCDGSGLDPDAYTTHETAHGTGYRHAPCRDCQPAAEESTR